MSTGFPEPVYDEDGNLKHSFLSKLEKCLQFDGIVPPERVFLNFYKALLLNRYGATGVGRTKVEVRGNMMDVVAFHTYGWSGNRQLISVLQKSPVWDWCIQRYDAGGHYYFDVPEVRITNPDLLREINIGPLQD